MLAVLGFHRSLTSVVAQWLHKSGLCMGEYLMPPAPSNPEGHYEDMPLVALHDGLLASQRTDWQFSGEVALSADAGLEAIQRYTALRGRLHGEHWGVKDPRHCLFLPNWQQVLGERGQYLVVLRHWSASIQSLLKRSAHDLSLGLGSPVSNGRFWQEPGHAARVWIAYNEKLLAFLEECPPEQRLVVTQQALMQGLSLPQQVSEKFAIPLDAATPSPIKPSLVHDEVEKSVQLHLTDGQMAQMDALWKKLLHYATHRVEREAPVWKAAKHSIRDRWFSRSILSASPFEAKSSASEPPEKASAADVLKFYRVRGQLPVANDSLWELVEHENPEKAGLWHLLAQTYLARGEHELASSAAQRALSIAAKSVGVLSTLAEADYRQLKLADAEQHTRAMLAIKPEETSAYVKLACVLLVSGKAEEAEKLLSSAIEDLGEVAILLHYRATLLDLLGRTDEAVQTLERVEEKPDLLERHLIALLLKSDLSLGRAHLKAWSKHRASTLEAWKKVSQALSGTESQPLRKDLALRVARIWNSNA